MNPKLYSYQQFHDEYFLLRSQLLDYTKAQMMDIIDRFGKKINSFIKWFVLPEPVNLITKIVFDSNNIEHLVTKSYVGEQFVSISFLSFDELLGLNYVLEKILKEYKEEPIEEISLENSEDDEPEFISVDNSEAAPGLYAYIDGESSFCDGSFEEIVDVKTKYDEKSGKPYSVIVVDSGNEYRQDTGVSVKGPTAYSLYGVYKKRK